MFPTEHPDGYADPSGFPICELALPGTRISPHLAGELGLMWADAEAAAKAAPRLTPAQAAKLRQTVLP